MFNPIAAHRGFSGTAPENTMAAFRMAFEHPGVEWIELDVQLSRDGVPVVIHDPALERTTNGSGMLRDCTFEELQRLDAGGWFSASFAGERIPSLEEVLTEARGRCKVNVEMKTAPDWYPGIEAAVLQTLERCSMMEDVIVTSFDHDAIVRLKGCGVRTGLLFANKPLLVHEQLAAAGATMVSMYYPFLTAQWVTELIEAGCGVMAWTVNEEPVLRHVAGLHPELLVCTNYPERMLALRTDRE